MEADITTLADLAIISNNETFSVFHKLDCCRTAGGRERMLHNFQSPLKDIHQINGIQQTLQRIIREEAQWPAQISNGSVMVIEKFYSTGIDEIPEHPSRLDAMAYKLFHGPDCSLVRYSTGHAFEFINGMHRLVEILFREDAPMPLRILLEKVEFLLKKEQLAITRAYKTWKEIPITRQLELGHFIRYRYKQQLLELLECWYQLDAWYGMAMAVKKFGLVFPEMVESPQPLLQMDGLYHILLQEPVDYDIRLDSGQNFLFLTGANMAGKSTFIKAIGTAVFLAHLGMGVPARSMQLSVFDGLLSNINVMDNIIKGESYFFNEVQRIKATVQKISDKRHWLILIDELFKGTNVQDAMKCSTAVIEGFLKIPGSIFVLSTHLYEIAEPLRQYPNIVFNYFETSVENDQLVFSYQLRKGISNDRLGYLILKNEGVVKMLEAL